MDGFQSNAAKWVGLMLIAIGVLASALILLSPAGLTTPLWIAMIGASTFLFAGASFLSQSMKNVVLRNICNLCLLVTFGVLIWFFLVGS